MIATVGYALFSTAKFSTISEYLMIASASYLSKRYLVLTSPVPQKFSVKTNGRLIGELSCSYRD